MVTKCVQPAERKPADIIAKVTRVIIGGIIVMKLPTGTTLRCAPFGDDLWSQFGDTPPGWCRRSDSDVFAASKKAPAVCLRCSHNSLMVAHGIGLKNRKHIYKRCYDVFSPFSVDGFVLLYVCLLANTIPPPNDPSSGSVGSSVGVWRWCCCGMNEIGSCILKSRRGVRNGWPPLMSLL